MSLGVLDGDGRAEGIAVPDEDSELELVVQPSARGELGFRATGRQDLSPRPADLQPGQADRGAAPVIADGQPFVVGEQRIVGPEQAAHGGRMMDGGVEIGEIADDRGERVFHPRLKHEAAFKGRPSIRSLQQAVEYGVAKRAPGGGTELHQTVQHRPGRAQDGGAGVGVPSPRLAAQKAQIQHLIPDRDTAAERLIGASSAKYGERQILNGKIALRDVRGAHPAFLLRIVGRIERHGWAALRGGWDRNASSGPASSRRSPSARAAAPRAHGAWV